MDFYTNPLIPEGINAPKEPPRSYVKPVLTVLGLLAGFLLVLDILARVIVTLLPFRWERALISPSVFEQNHQPEAQAIEDELAALAERLVAVMDLPEDIIITVHYNEADLVNAYAALGGQVTVYRGLLEKINSEDALAMVLAHEIGHVKNRDISKKVFRVMGLAMLLSTVDSSAGNLLDGLTEVGLLGYSRAQEAAADKEATRALSRLYGHTYGVESFFNSLAAEEDKSGLKLEALEMLSTHPDTAKRLKQSRKMAQKQGWPTSGPLTPLPEALLLRHIE